MCYESKLLLSCIGLLLCLSDLTAHGAEFSWHYQTLSVDGENWRLRIPSETQLELLTTDLDGPRLMTFLPNGDLIVGSRSGNVYLLKPPYTTPHVLVNLPGYPHSVAYRDGMLFIARTDGLYRAPYRSGQETLAGDELQRVAGTTCRRRPQQP